MANDTTWRRRNYLVRPGFQIRFTLLLMLQMATILAALGLMVYSHVSGMGVIAESIPFASSGAHLAFQHELMDNMHGFFSRSLVLIGATTVIMVLFGLFASHRLAGPIVKLEGYLNAVADGDFSHRIAFRRNDHLDEFAGHINSTVEQLEASRLEAKEIGIELVRRCRRLDEPSQRERTLAEMDRLVVKLRGVV